MKMVTRSKWWYFVVYAFYAASLTLFPISLTMGVPLSVAYAVWSGIGTMLTVLVATVFFKERLTWQMVIAIVVIVGGVVSLNYLSSSEGVGETNSTATRAHADQTSTGQAIQQLRVDEAPGSVIGVQPQSAPMHSVVDLTAPDPPASSVARNVQGTGS